ncbi:MAG: hypothetical protein GX247_01085 [Mollicutes bacterium]|nr:hypothetical protein [Mollicutes bacterium]
MKKRKINPKKLILFIIVVIIVIGLIVGSILILKASLKGKEEPNNEEKEIIDNILDYTLDEDETEYYKNLFNQLKEVLNQDEINEEEYAKLVAQLFVADFFNLDNKINKNDIGGTQFVYKDFRSDFEKLARDSIYNHIENNIYGDRKQELPVVHSVAIENISQKKYTYNDKVDEKAYYIDVLIKYEKDLGYQEEASLILIHNEEKLEIAEMNEK